MKSSNNGDWSQSRFKIIMGFMTSILYFRLRIMENARNMTHDLIIVTKFHGSRSCVTEGQVKQSSPGK